MGQEICDFCGRTDKAKSYSFNYGMYKSWQTGASRVESRGSRLVEVTPTKYQQQILGESSVCLCRSCKLKRLNTWRIKKFLYWIIFIIAMVIIAGMLPEHLEVGLSILIGIVVLIVLVPICDVIEEKLLCKIFKIDDVVNKEWGSWSNVIEYYQNKKFESIKKGLDCDYVWKGWTCMIFDREQDKSKS